MADAFGFWNGIGVFAGIPTRLMRHLLKAWIWLALGFEILALYRC